MARTTRKIETTQGQVDVKPVHQETIVTGIIGRSPLIFHAMSLKVRQELLFPAEKKRGSKPTTLKHVPLEEYRDSVYRTVDPAAPTVLAFPAGGFKKSMAVAALQVDGLTKISVLRNIWVEPDERRGNNLFIFGTPIMSIMPVRMQDVNRTPDMRTRAIVLEWTTRLRIRFDADMFTGESVMNLVAHAGQREGIGDGRIGSGYEFGAFAACDVTDPDFLEICQNGGRIPQAAALETPGYYDVETERLYEFWEKAAAASPRGKQQIKLAA
jgi:hypothetical protein